MGRSILLAGMLLIAALAMTGGTRTATADDTGLNGPDGMLSLAQAAEARGDYRLALDLYQRAQEAFPWSSEPLTDWGLLAAQLGAAEQAATLLTAALGVDPDDMEAAAGLAQVLVDLDRLDEALPLYELVLRQDPSDVAAREGRHYVLAQIGTTAQAAVPPTLAEITTSQTSREPTVVPGLIDTSLPARPAAALWR